MVCGLCRFCGTSIAMVCVTSVMNVLQNLQLSATVAKAGGGCVCLRPRPRPAVGSFVTRSFPVVVDFRIAA